MRQKVIAEFETPSKRCLRVWCDGTQEELGEVEGISHVIPAPFAKAEFYVYLDPRYDPETIRKEILNRFS